jgi:prepilin-type N-terminal cleavage/methylation domain-containing protein
MNRGVELQMSKQTNSERGFSLIEVLVVVAVALVMFAIGLPSFLQSYRTYQLDSAAAQVSGILKSTRSAAIQLNAQIPINCVIQVAGGQTQIWADSNIPVNDGIEQATEPQILLSGNVNLVQAAIVPNTGGLAAAIGVQVLTATPPVNGVADTFDGRGAANPAAPGVFVLYVGNTAVPTAGYRAVVLMPSGSIQVWSTDAAGNWHQVS